MACSGCLDERVSWVPAYRSSVVDREPARWELAGAGYEADETVILFCPFCGVKLDAEAPENGAVWGVQSFADWVRLEYRVAHDRELREARETAENIARFEAYLGSRISCFPVVRHEELLEELATVTQLLCLRTRDDARAVNWAARLMARMESP